MDGGHVATSCLKGAFLWPLTPKPGRDEGTDRAGKEQEKAQAFEWALGRSSGRKPCHLYNAICDNPTDGTVVRTRALAFKQAGLNSEPHTYSCVTVGSLSLFESLSLPLAWVMDVRVEGSPIYGAPSPSLGS